MGCILFQDLEMELTEEEKTLIDSHDICRISTIGFDNAWPHCVPVGYVHLNQLFYVPADRNSKKIRNLVKNKKATILVDDAGTESGVMLECETNLLNGEEAEPFLDYMKITKGWQNDLATTIIQLKPLQKSSWFKKPVSD
jgi:general stress protein 26